MRWDRMRRVIVATGVLIALLIAGGPRVLRPARAFADSGITLNPSSGPVGTVVAVTINQNGKTYSPGAPVDFYYVEALFCDNPATAHTTVGADGRIPTTSITIPAGARSDCGGQILVLVNNAEDYYGPTDFQVTSGGGASGTPATSTGTPLPGGSGLALTPGTAALGQPIGFSAGGFRAGEAVTLAATINSATVNLTPSGGQVTANGGGTASGTFSLPTNSQTIASNGAGGNAGYTGQLRLTGSTSGQVVTGNLVVPATTLKGSPAPLSAGGPLAVTGTGFQANEAVTLTLTTANGASIGTPTTVTAGQDGTIGTSLNGPATNGSYNLKAMGQASNLAAQAAVQVGPLLGIAVSPALASPGQAVTVRGTAFSANSTVTVTGLSGQNTVQADGSGNFSLSLIVPTNPSSPVLTVRASDPTGLNATTSLTLDNGQAPAIAASASTAALGQALIVNGSNFAAGEQVSVALAPLGAPQSPLGGTGQTVAVDQNRAFTLTYTVPSAVAQGSYLLVATGLGSGRAATAPLTVQGSAITLSATPTLPAVAGTVAFPTATPGGSSGFGFSATPIPSATATTPPPYPSPAATATVIPAATETTYFAEGYTGRAAFNHSVTFREELILFNSTRASTIAHVAYYIAGSGGSTRQVRRAVALGPLGVARLSVDADAGVNRLISIAVGHDRGVVAETVIARSDAQGATLDVAASAGSTQAARLWNFAEGYAGEAFQEYLSIFNPTLSPAAIQVQFLPSSGIVPPPLALQVPPNGRVSVNVRAAYLRLAGPRAAKSIAVSLGSDQPVVADRALYWGSGSGSGKFGYEVSPGIPGGATTVLFPALLRRGANQPYITVFNPGGSRARVRAIFRATSGRVLTSYATGVEARARLTLDVRGLVPAYDGVVSAVLSATMPVATEASTYIGGSPNVGRHPGVTVLGVEGSASAASAALDPSSVAYLFNPGAISLQVTVGVAGGGTVPAAVVVPPYGIDTLPLGAGGAARGLLLTAQRPFAAAVINGGLSGPTAWGGTLLPPG